MRRADFGEEARLKERPDSKSCGKEVGRYDPVTDRKSGVDRMRLKPSDVATRRGDDSLIDDNNPGLKVRGFELRTESALIRELW